jgi:CHAT domain-containing protein
MAKIVLAIIIAAWLSPGLSAAGEEEWNAYVRDGTSAYERGDYSAANRQFELAINEAEASGTQDLDLARKQSVHLQLAATETNVKKADLTRYRVLAFATHGLMAGDFRGLAEPALVLTPPDNGTEFDDGLLTASEVAQLKLNADWVILSACNTAAADDTPGAEGLSGLAKAFFYAGSRALLVSHWPVASAATEKLTTRMFKEGSDNPGIGKAEALRRSMLAMMADEKSPQLTHPAFWAPFVVVGEGAGAQTK